MFEELLKLFVESPREIVNGMWDWKISMPNIPFPTMGGHVFWNTLAEYKGWKLQQNMITQHARILDENDVRRAWGSVQGMKKVLERLQGKI